MKKYFFYSNKMWFNSKLLKGIQETNEEATIYDCIDNKDSFKEHIQDFINLNITKKIIKYL